ncbi:MAG: 2-hydroxyacyl-CoA dehydratase, partial [Acidimicrobiales bacterium]
MSLPGSRSVKRLRVTSEFNRHQRDWFTTLRQRAENGDPIALVNADAPHEIFRAMDIPYVVVQWWSSLLSAKQRAGDCLASLRSNGYPDNDEQYSALGLGEMLRDAPDSPWGGLPSPSVMSGVITTDGSAKVLEAWAKETDANCYLFESTVDGRKAVETQWWDRLPWDWEELLEPTRLDLMVDEFGPLIASLEDLRGRPFSVDGLGDVMSLANQQFEYYRKTRDLIARQVPAPVSVVDTMPATMVPQWHRGSAYGRDAAKALYEEVRAKADAGDSACPDERIRLMWLGRGLWSNMGLYQHFEREFGAVFVWSMYLSLAADGYLRYGADPLRTLASRFVPMIEILRMPTWSSSWHVKEAEWHQIDGAISLGEDDYFSVRALEARGIPVLRIS